MVNHQVLNNQEILLEGENIIEVKTQGVPSPADIIIDGSNLVAMPGFVNTHTHLWQHVAKSVAAAEQLQQWVRKVYKFQPYFEPHSLYQVTRAAAGEALRSGITTVVDYTSVNRSEFALNTTIKALKDSHLDGAVMWTHQDGFLPPAQKAQLIENARQLGGDNLEVWMGFGPLAFYPLPSVYDGVVTAQALNMRMAEHTMENLGNVRDFLASTQRYLTQYGQQLGTTDKTLLENIVALQPPADIDEIEHIRRRVAALESNNPEIKQQFADVLPASQVNTMAVYQHWQILKDYLSIHSVWVQPQWLTTLKNSGTFINHNPESNQYLGSGIAPILQYLEAEVPLSLGTDGAASNDRIDMFSAMRFAANLQKVAVLDMKKSGAFDPWTILTMATMGGAKVLHQQHRIGSLQAGKQADMILLNKKQTGSCACHQRPTATGCLTHQQCGGRSG